MQDDEMQCDARIDFSSISAPLSGKNSDTTLPSLFTCIIYIFTQLLTVSLTVDTDTIQQLEL